MIIASAKNKSVGNAFIASLFFGAFALLYYIFASSVPVQEQKVTFSCSKCNTPVSEADAFCPKCGDKLDDEDGVKCPKCNTFNDENSKFCSKCGLKLIADPEETCTYCCKKFKDESHLKKHLADCTVKIETERKDRIILFWVLGSLVTFILCFIFYFVNKINIIPTVVVFFVVSPFFNKFFDKFKHKHPKLKTMTMNWWRKGVIIGSIIILFILINLLIPECPNSCDDGKLCTNDFCSASTGYKCMNTLKLNCNGNGICESAEYGTADCPSCDDNIKCTADTYDTSLKQCIHSEIKGCIK